MKTIRGIKRKFKEALHFINKMGPTSVILFYHRVAEPPLDPNLICVTPKHFSEHLKVLKSLTYPISLQQLCDDIQNGRIQDQTSVLTFDDGYADNLHNAKPLLQKYDIPATVFVTAEKLERQTEYWWDQLERILLSQEKIMNPKLHLEIKGKSYVWCFDQVVDSQTNKHWHVLMEKEPSARHSAFKELLKIMTFMTSSEREQVLYELRQWAGIQSINRKDYQILSTDELRALVSDGLVDIGAHSMSHSALSALDIADQKIEIENSKHKIESIIGTQIKSFSYPFGGRQHYTCDTVQLVRGAGFSCACTTIAEVVHRKTDPFQFPRFVVRDWDGDEFEEKIASFFNK